jgi:hypothetical protein
VNSVQADFDRIALLDSAGFDHNAHYHRLILEALPKSAAAPESFHACSPPAATASPPSTSQPT